MRLLLKGGRVIDPANKIDGVNDVLIIDGKIAAVEPELAPQDCETVDVSGKIVCPGFIDMHVHMREPGFEYKEDIASGTRAAAAGGFTAVCCMPNTKPVIDNIAVAGFVKERARKCGVVNVLPVGAISKGQEGKELAEIADLVAAGCVAISDDGKPVMRADIMRNALKYAKMFALPVLSHCEDLNLSQDGQMHEGYYSTIYGLKGIPAVAEDIMAARDILLAKSTGAHVHICHLSTKGAVELVRRAKEEGVSVSCEVTPHHLALSDEIAETYDADTKVNPPLRSEEHIAALREALSDGTVNCIATDHAPHEKESKDCEYHLASPGISGLETAVAVIMDKLVSRGLLDVKKMVELFTTGPAAVLRIDSGTLTPGKPADVTVIDPDIVKKVDPAVFYSKGRNTPFKGMGMKGWPYMTIVSGKVVARDGKVIV